MKANRIEELPEGYAGDYDTCELDEYDMGEMPKNITEFWYWYGSGCYEGAGQLLILDDSGFYHLHDMGHCSCYGPTDRIGVSEGRGLDELFESCTDALKKEVVMLFDAARKAAGK